MTSRQERFSISSSALDKKRFGIPVARAFHPATPGDAAKLLAFCKRKGIRLCIARIDAVALPAVLQLRQQGFFLTDTLITWAWRLEAKPPTVFRAKIPVRSAGRKDVNALVALTQAAFRKYSNHYQNDPRLERKAADAVYPDWIRRAVTASASDKVWVSQSGKQLTGFAAVSLCARAAAVDLTAVHPDFKGRGHFKALMTASAAWAKKRGARELTIATQVTNKAVQHACLQLGFTPLKASYTLHGWL